MHSITLSFLYRVLHGDFLFFLKRMHGDKSVSIRCFREYSGEGL